jgi:kynurenine formamidase
MSRENNWGRWGPEDEQGTLNLLDPDRVRAAMSLVRTGRVYGLGLPIQSTGVPLVSGRHPAAHLMAVDGGDFAAGARTRDGVGFADDYIFMATHGSTHIDALSHAWSDGVMYNGFSSNEVRSSGARRNGIDRIPPIVGRGVLMDVAKMRGVDLLTGDAASITVSDLEECERVQGVEIREGDIVVVRTGWVESFFRDPDRARAENPGLTKETADWFARRDVAVVAADNLGVEKYPETEMDMLPLHVRLIRDFGIHLMELLVVAELSKESVTEFLFVAGVLRIRRGVGSPLNPVAIT